MEKLRLLLIVETCLCFCLFSVFGNVFLDGSADNCVGAIQKDALGNEWVKYESMNDSFSCLKVCLLSNHTRAKAAAYGAKHGCFCSHLGYTKLYFGAESNISYCADSMVTTSKEYLKVYNMSGWTVRLRFDDFIEWNKKFNLDIEALFYQNGTYINDSKILKNILLPKNACKIITRKGKIMIRKWCLEDFDFQTLGENQICLKTTENCEKVMVLQRVTSNKIIQSHVHKGMKLESSVTGNVFNLSFYVDDEQVKTILPFREYGEITFELCKISWEFFPRAFKLDKVQTLVVRAWNPLYPVQESYKTFKISLGKYNFNFSHFFYPTRNEIKTRIEAYPVVSNKYDLNYKWSLDDSCINVTLSASETFVPNVTTTTRSYDISHHANSKCNITFIPLGKDQSKGDDESTTSKKLFFHLGQQMSDNVNVFCTIDPPNDSFLRGEEAKFVIKKQKWLKTPLPLCHSHVWKLNGNVISRNRYIFNAPGRYTVSVSCKFESIEGWISKDVFILERLTKLEINATSLHYFGQPITMRAIVNYNEHVTYRWDFGDGHQYNTSSDVVEHRYYKSGIYTVRVFANNGFGEISASKDINGTELCPDGEFKVSFENGKEIKQFRRLPVHLEVVIRKLACLEPVTITLTWTIFNWTENEWRMWKEFKQNNGKLTNSIYIPPNVLEYGKYRFNVTVTISFPDFVVRYSEQFSTTINVTASPLFALLRGGPTRYVGENSTFFLDASPSFDPDNLNENLQYSWSIPGTDTYKMTDPMIKVEAEKFKGKTMQIAVTVSSRNRWSVTRQKIIIKQSDNIKSNIILDCPSCDTQYLNPSKPTKMIQKCTNNDCASSDRKTLWKLYEQREVYGLPKLEEIPCTDSDQGPLSVIKNKTTPKITYEFYSCKHEKSSRYARGAPNQDMKPVQLRIGKIKERNSELLHFEKNFFPGKRSFIIMLKDKEFSDDVLAMRSFNVLDKPRDSSCHVVSIDGIELLDDFEVTCHVTDKNARLLYKVLYKRQSINGTITSNMFFQRKTPQFKFHLPSGDKNSLIISIENENGVAREYCDIQMTVKGIRTKATVNVEEYLYNRSLEIKKWLPEHPYAYYGQTLYNITLISDVLNRQPSVSHSNKSFHLRRKIREVLINVLRNVTVSSEYVAQQFASSLESCTKIPEELTNASAVEVVEILYKLMTRKRYGKEESFELSEAFQMDIFNVTTRIKTMLSGKKEYELKLLTSLNHLFKDILKTKFVRTPLEVMNKFVNKIFVAKLVKFSPYRDEIVNFQNGKARVTLKTKGVRTHKKYHCDLFGCGLQAVTMEMNPLEEDNYLKISSLTKLKVDNCKLASHCGKRITEVNIDFPIILPNRTLPVPKVYRLTTREKHRYTLQHYAPTPLCIEVIPVGSWSRRFKLKVEISCADSRYKLGNHHRLYVTRRRQEFYPSNIFKENCKDLNITVDIYWEVEPTRYERLRTEVMYNFHIISLDCLSKKGNSDWVENFCSCDTDAGFFLNCSCPKLEGSEYSYIAVAKTLPNTMQEIFLESETNGVISIFMLVLSLCYVVTIFTFFIKERQQYKNSIAIPLERCDPSHTHKYKITVYTGHCCGAQTTAKVAVVLNGENNSSYPVELFTKDRELFRQNSRDVFVVSVRENLGSLNCIHLWHDNSGSSPSWFVDKLVIKDLSTNQKWIFKCSRWLAVDKNDGRLDCKIKPSDFQRKLTFKEFQLEFGEKLMDFHIWLSLFRMPKYSLFTRAERLTCCMVLFSAYQFFNAHFCRNYKDIFVMDCVSVFNPTLLQFKAGVFTTLCCIPIFLFFTVIFRYTKSFVWLQPAKNAKVNEAFVSNSGLATSIHKTSKVKKRDIVSEIDRSSGDARCQKQLRFAALLVEALYNENEVSSSDRENDCPDEDSTPKSSSPDDLSGSNSNIEQEAYSFASTGSWLLFPNTTLFRVPTCFNVLMWAGCILTLLFLSLYTVEYVSRFDDLTVNCYAQSLFWSLLISFFVLQPFQAFFVTVVQTIRRQFVLHSTIIDETGQEMNDDVVVDDSMFASFTEKNFEDPLYRKLFCLKYLQPLSKKVVTKARVKLLKRKETVMFLRDVLMYFFLLVFLYSVNPFWNQKLIFFHNNALETFFKRDINTSSLLTWWSSSSQKFVDTLKFDEETLTVRAFHDRALIIGNPELTMTFTYCQSNHSFKMHQSVPNESTRNCTKKKEKKSVTFDDSQKNNWLGLARSIYESYNEHVTDISLAFVIFSPPLDVYSLIKLSGHMVFPSAHVQNDVIVATAAFYVDKSSTFSIKTTCQLLFTLVPVLLLIRQLYSRKKYQKIRTGLGVKIEFFIVFLSFWSVILMWIWIKHQYFTMGILLRQYEANIVNDVQLIYNYQEAFKYFIALLLFFVVIKVSHVIGLDKLLDCHIEAFGSVISSLLFPMLALLVVLVGFAHVGVLLFQDHLKMFETFLQAFSLNVLYLRNPGSQNYTVNTPYQQMLLAVYVIAFCSCMMLFSSLLKAAFCQAGINYVLTVKNRRRIPLKVFFLRKIRRIYSLISSYLHEPEDNDDTLKRVPMSYIFKELDEQLNDLEFRLTHLTCKSNMPAKDTTDDCSSSDGSDVEYVYQGESKRPSFSTGHRDVSVSENSSFEFPTLENMSDTDIECISRKSSASGSMTTHAETTTSSTATKRRRPFERSMRAFPTPSSEASSTSARPQVLLSPWVNEEDCLENEQTLQPTEQRTTEDCKIDEDDTKVNARSTGASTYNFKIKELYGKPNVNYSKRKDKTSERPQLFVNHRIKNAYKGNGDDFCGNLTPPRPKVRLDAFDDEFS